MMAVASWVHELLSVLATFVALGGAAYSLWRWRRTSRRIETPDRDSLPELEERYAAAKEAHERFPSRMAYQVHNSQEFAGLSAVITSLAGAFLLIVILQTEFGGPFAPIGLFFGVVGVTFFYWTAGTIGRLADRRRLVAADFDRLDQIARRIEVMKANPLS